MLISAIITTYNRAGLALRAVRSVLAQSHPHIEVLIIDDGSTDGTREAINDAFGDDARIHYHYQENRGCAAARNAGLHLARGEAFAFLDSDDEWEPDALKSLHDELVSSGADFVYSPAIEIAPDGTERVNIPVSAGSPAKLAERHFLNTNVRNGAVLFHRRALETVPGLDELLLHNEDSDFLQKIAIVHRAAYCVAPTVRVHHHADNKSKKRAAIYQALLKSSRDILAAYPEFARSLGSKAVQRLADLEGLLISALIQEGQFSEANEYINNRNNRTAFYLRTSAKFHIRWPLKIKRLFNRIAARLFRRA